MEKSQSFSAVKHQRRRGKKSTNYSRTFPCFFIYRKKCQLLENTVAICKTKIIENIDDLSIGQRIQEKRIEKGTKAIDMAIALDISN